MAALFFLHSDWKQRHVSLLSRMCVWQCVCSRRIKVRLALSFTDRVLWSERLAHLHLLQDIVTGCWWCSALAPLWRHKRRKESVIGKPECISSATPKPSTSKFLPQRCIFLNIDWFSLYCDAVKVLKYSAGTMSVSLFLLISSFYG